MGLSESEKQIANNLIIPTEKKLFFSTEIPGSGFWRSLKGSFEKSVLNTGNTILSFLGRRGDTERAFELLNAPIDESRFTKPGESPLLQNQYAELVDKQNSGQITEEEKKKKDDIGNLS